MTAAEALDRGRGSFGRHAWADAYAELSAADHEAPLEATDLERLAMAAYLVGRDDDGDHASARAFQECLRLGRNTSCCPVRILVGPRTPVPR